MHVYELDNTFIIHYIRHFSLFVLIVLRTARIVCMTIKNNQDRVGAVQTAFCMPIMSSGFKMYFLYHLWLLSSAIKCFWSFSQF